MSRLPKYDPLFGSRNYLEPLPERQPLRHERMHQDFLGALDAFARGLPFRCGYSGIAQGDAAPGEYVVIWWGGFTYCGKRLRTERAGERIRAGDPVCIKGELALPIYA